MTAAASCPPRAVGRMVGQPVPVALVNVGTVVELLDGTIGVVQHYECFSPKQTQFPVRIGAQTLLLTREHLRSAPEVAVPAPRQEAARSAQRASATL